MDVSLQGAKLIWFFDYRKVSSNMSCLEANSGFFRLLRKGIFKPYVLQPFDKKFIYYNKIKTFRQDSLRGSPTEIWPQMPKWGSSHYYSSHCLEGKKIHGSTGSTYLQEKDQSTVHKVHRRQWYRPACPRTSYPIHKHHDKNMECRSWTSTCNYSGGCQITCQEVGKRSPQININSSLTLIYFHYILPISILMLY